jgi:hypothetical protein
MNLDELKDKVIELFGRFYMNVNHKCKLFRDIDKIFSEYEQANSKEEEELVIQPKIIGTMDVKLKRRTQEEMNTYILLTMENNRQNHAKEIEAMKKQIEGLYKDNGEFRNHIAKINRAIDYQEMPTPEKKEERFYCNEFEFASSHQAMRYELIDRKGIFKHKGLCDARFAQAVCEFLNSQEAGK